MTVAPQLAVGTAIVATDDTSYSVFQNLNGPNSTQLVFGNIFLGLQGAAAIRIAMGELKGLDRGAKIDNSLINAALSLVRNAAWPGGDSATITVALDEQPRRLEEDSAMAMKKETDFGPAWRRDGWGQWDVQVRRPDTSTIVDLGTGVLDVQLRPAVDRRLRIGQLFTIGVGETVRDVICRLRRYGTPTGSVELVLYPSESDGWSQIRPDEDSPIAVSGAVANATIPTTAGGTDVTFTFAPDVVLAAGSYWAVLRPSGTPWTESATDTIAFLQSRGFLFTGGSVYTAGNRFDTFLYRGHVDVHFDILARASSGVAWALPAGAVGGTSPSPDLTSIVQEACLARSHETINALIFSITTSGATGTYRVAAATHPTRSPPGFACQFTRRNVRGGVL